MNKNFFMSTKMESQRKNKNINTFIGILHGILSDGRIEKNEIQYLVEWIKKNNDGLENVPMYDELYEKLTHSLENEITSEQENTLKTLIQFLTGNTWNDTKDTSTMPINLYEKDPNISFKNRLFCFTGELEFGSKETGKKIVETLGGLCKDSVTQDLDYLVVGKLGSHNWKHGNWGEKISKASRFIQSKKTRLSIISEDDWKIAIIKNASKLEC